MSRLSQHDALLPVLGAAPVGVGFYDAELRYTWVNEALATIHGRPAAEHVGRTIVEVNPHAPADVVELFARVLETGEPIGDHVVSSQTAAEPSRDRHWSISVFPSRGPSGDPGLGSIITEVTAMQVARQSAATLKEALAVEATILEQVIARVPIGVTLLWGRELRYRVMNGQGRRMLPDRGPLVGRTPAEVYPETAATFAATIAPLFDSGEELTLRDYRLPFDEDPGALDGERSYDVTFTPIRVDGPVGGILVTYLDVTDAVRERRELERELAEERRIADTLQRALLPRRLPDVPGIEFAVRYQPAGERFEVGGDFYDVFPAHDGSWIAVVGDVCGKGPRAAARTSMVRYALRAEATHAERPADLLQLLNEDVRRDLAAEDEADFVTLVLLSLSPGDDGVGVCLASAGHPAAILTGPGGAWRLLGSPALPVGVADDPTYEQHGDHLAPGERLVLYTDGLLDAHAPDAALTTEDLATLAAEGGTVEEVADRLLAHITEADAPARDDCALVVVGLRDV